MIKLRTANINDLVILQHWQQQPHVIEAIPPSDWNWAYELKRQTAWRQQLIAELNGQPIGFVQIIDPAEEETHYWGEIEPNKRAIDIWIGDKNSLGKGYGKQMMYLAIEKCFESPLVDEILLDPLESNTKAIKFYEQLGFTFIEFRQFPDVKSPVYTLKRATWLTHNTNN